MTSISAKRFVLDEARVTGLRLVLLAVALFLCSCKDKDVSVDEKLVNLFVDLRVCEQLYGGESASASLARREVLNRHGYDRERFLSEVNVVLSSKEQWVPFQKAVNDRIDLLLGIPKPEEPQKKGKKK